MVNDDERSFALAINSFAGNLIGEYSASSGNIVLAVFGVLVFLGGSDPIPHRGNNVFVAIR